MNKVVIVDDEPIILEGISSSLKLMSINIDIVGSFTSSVTALAFLKDHQVDIVITDINMPQYTGIDLIKRVKQLSPATEIIILTGFGSLAYATEAMRYGVKFFLEKPVDAGQLELAIRESIVGVKEAKKSISYRKKAEIEQLIMNRNYHSELIEDNFTLIMYDAVLFSVIDEALTKVIELSSSEIISGSAKGAVYYVIFDDGKTCDDCCHLLEKRKFPQGILFFGKNISSKSLYNSFTYAQSLFAFSFYYERLTCFFVEDIEARKKSDYAQIVEKFKSDVNELLDNNQFTVLDKVITSFFEKVKEGLFPVNFLRFQIQIFSEEILEKRATKKLDMDSELSVRILNATSNKELHYLFTSITNRIKTESQLDNTKDIVANLNLIIENEFPNESLSLRWISKKRLFLNPEYLGKVYLKSTGKKFNQRLLEKRIEVSKELIIQNKKVYEVAEAVGFHDNPEYFTKKFKELVGQTPKAYQMRQLE